MIDTKRKRLSYDMEFKLANAFEQIEEICSKSIAANTTANEMIDNLELIDVIDHHLLHLIMESIDLIIDENDIVKSVNIYADVDQISMSAYTCYYTYPGRYIPDNINIILP